MYSDTRSDNASSEVAADDADRKILKPLLSSLLLGAATLISIPAALAQDGSTVRLDTVVVDGEGQEGAGGDDGVDGVVVKKASTAGKTSRVVVRTSQSVNTVAREEMEQRGATTVTEALRYTPGVVAEGRPTTRYDIGYIRGFGGLQNWFDFVDGMKMQRGLSYNAPAMDAWNIDRVEVLKGPASVLYGQIMPGGLVNQITKKPLDEAHREVQVTVGAPGRAEAAFDFTGPVAGTEDLSYRLVGLGRYQESNIDFADTERWFIAPSLTWKATPDTSLTVYAGYMRDPSSVYPLYLPAFGTVIPNAAFPDIPYDFNVEGKDYSKFDRKQAWAGYEFEHNFTDQLKFTQKLRYMDTESDFQGLAVVGMAGTSITRRPSKALDDAGQVTVDNQLEYAFDTGVAQHKVLAGLDFQYLDADRYLGQAAALSPIDYLNPNYTAPAVPALTGYTTLQRSQTGVYLQDQIDIGKLAATAGVRYDVVSYDLDAYSYNAATGAKTPLAIGSADQTVDDFSWNVGAAYVFDNGIAPYASYATSFEVTAGTGLGGVAFEPTTARQFEVGVRYQPTSFNGMFTASYFDIEQKNVLTSSGIAGTVANGCSAATCQNQLGKVRSRGLELEAKTQVVPGFDVVASYTYVHARVLEDTTAMLVGSTPAGVPTHQAALWGHYQFNENSMLGGLGVGAGVRYLGNTTALYAAGKLEVPAFTLVDAAVSYDFGVKTPALQGMKLSVSASNLFNKEYVASCSNSATAIGSCYYGTGREVKATLSYKW